MSTLHPLLDSLSSLCSKGQVPFRLCGTTLCGVNMETILSFRTSPDGSLLAHRYGEDISQDDEHSFGAGNTARDIVDFALGVDQEPEAADPARSAVEELTVEERLCRMEAAVHGLGEEYLRLRAFLDAFDTLLRGERG